MAYLAFEAEGGDILVEVSPQETAQQGGGVVKAGIGDRLQDGVARAQATFERALSGLVERSAGAFVRAVNALDDPPDQIEMQFAIKATGEAGNLAVGKLSGDANYSVKLTWSKGTTGQPPV